MITITREPSEVKVGDALYVVAIGVCVVEKITVAKAEGKTLYAFSLNKKSNKAALFLWWESLDLVNVIKEF